jgi:hypothetical protein
MFSGHPDPLVWDTGPKIVRKTYSFVTSLWLLFLKNDASVPSKSNKLKNLFMFWRSLAKIAGSGCISQKYGSAYPDPVTGFSDLIERAAQAARR